MYIDYWSEQKRLAMNREKKEFNVVYLLLIQQQIIKMQKKHSTLKSHIS